MTAVSPLAGPHPTDPQNLRYLMALQRRQAALLARDKLLRFAQLLRPDPNHAEDPNFSLYQAVRHHEVIAAALEEVEAGRIKRLIVNCPPRHGKSELVSRLFPAWFIGRHPSSSLIQATYNEKFSWDFGREVRQIIEDPIYGQVFPKIALTSASVDRVETTANGKLFFVGRGGSITGRGAIGLILDDPIKDRTEADSPALRNKLWSWYTQVIKSRLLTSKGWIVIVQCLTGDTQISMADGRLKRLDEIEPGDRVISWDGTKIVASTVTACIDNGIDQTYLIRTKNTEVRANARHPFLVLSKDGLQWVRTRDLRPGMRIVAQTRENTPELSAALTVATLWQNAEVCATGTTPRQNGLLDQDLLRMPHLNDWPTVASGATALLEPTLTACLPNREVFAPSAELMAVLENPSIGLPISFPITITTPESCVGSCATIATGLPDELEVPKFWNVPSTTSEPATEIVESVTIFGAEHVYDLTIAETHNFIANGLWCHNTRWHEDDLVGRITDPTNIYYNEAEARKWRIIDLPALARDHDPLGRKPGQALWPSRFPKSYLEEMREGDARGFQALYQGSPTPEKGHFFDGDRIKLYHKQSDLPPKETLRFYAASDHAVSTKQDADKTCMGVVGIDPDDNIWLMPELVWGRYPTDRIVELMIDMMAKYKPIFWWAEKGHISKSIGPFLRKRMLERQTFASVYEMTPSTDKQSRAQAIQARIAMGKVYMPSFAPWWGEARNEMLKFPFGTHDDFVDFLSWVGIGLVLQVPRAPKKETKAPKVGTLGWIKAESKRQKREDEGVRNGGW
jgi:predicted phage terminase large subunit-like protein